jgi:hypothetical protein
MDKGYSAVLRGIRETFFLISVEKRDKQTLLKAIKYWILPGTTIISDCWKVIIKTFIVKINCVLPLNITRSNFNCLKL